MKKLEAELTLRARKMRYCEATKLLWYFLKMLNSGTIQLITEMVISGRKQMIMTAETKRSITVILVSAWSILDSVMSARI